jgi:hypothetical protein
MPVVVGDFEVVVDSPVAPPPEAAGAGADAEPVVLTPAEVEMLLERQAERVARVRAH